MSVYIEILKRWGQNERVVKEMILSNHFLCSVDDDSHLDKVCKCIENATRDYNALCPNTLWQSIYDCIYNNNVQYEFVELTKIAGLVLCYNTIQECIVHKNPRETFDLGLVGYSEAEKSIVNNIFIDEIEKHALTPNMMVITNSNLFLLYNCCDEYIYDYVRRCDWSELRDCLGIEYNDYKFMFKSTSDYSVPRWVLVTLLLLENYQSGCTSEKYPNGLNSLYEILREMQQQHQNISEWNDTTEEDAAVYGEDETLNNSYENFIDDNKVSE